MTLKAERFKAPLLRRTISMGDCRSCSHSRGLVTFYYRQVFAVAVAEATVRSRTRQQTTRRWRRLSQDAPFQTLLDTRAVLHRSFQSRCIEFVGQNVVATGDLFGQAGQDGTFSG